MLDHHFRQRGIAMIDSAGGGSMPSVFTDARAEHLATRRCAGLFDFSFMACWELSGRDALSFLQRLQTRNIATLAPGKLCYTLLCREDGSVLNDATVWRHPDGRFWLFTGNRNDQAHLMAHADGHDLTLKPIHAGLSVLALQGPRSKAMLAPLVEPGVLDRLRYFSFVATRLAGQPVVIGRLGYSGEYGYELIVPASEATATWQQLHAHGRQQGLLECGFEAANSLRVESGYILFSSELQHPVTPGQLRLDRLVDWYPGGFIGQQALRARSHAKSQPPAGLAPGELVGIRLDHDAVPWPRQAVLARITSIARSPVFECELALGFVDAAHATPGTIVRDTAGRRGRIQRLPFYDPARCLPRRDPACSNSTDVST